MTKLYYDCPIKAAYMAKEFGVGLGVWDPNDGSFFKWDGWHTPLTGDDGEISLYYKKIYIHPDSHHIFDPWDGDLAFVDDSHVTAIGTLGFDEMDETHLLTTPDHDTSAIDLCSVKEIIMRDDKHFFMPEEE